MKLRSIGLIVTLALGILAAPLTAQVRQPAKVYRIGVLSGSGRTSAPHVRQAFYQRLRDLGYVEGQNIIIEWRWAEGKLDRLPDLAAELVQLNVDLIVATAPAPVLAAKNATRTIPIVMVFTPDPVQLGLVASLARPEGNITGLSSMSIDLSAKQLELLKEAVPKILRVAVLMNPANPWHALGLKEVGVRAQALALDLEILEVRRPEEFEDAFSAITRKRGGAVLVLADPMFFTHRTRLAELAAKHRLPAVYGLREHVEAGGLMSYWPNTVDSTRQATTYVDRILKGAKPGELPIEQPTRFELVINLKTAKALGLTIPPSVLVRADQVIQ